MIASGPADLRDQAWLDARIADIESGVEAVLDIAGNWLAGRMLSRLWPGVSAAEYVRAHVGPLRLGKADVTVLLTETNWSNRQIAAVAGVGRTKVNEVAAELAENGQFDRPAETLGGDGVLRSYPRPVAVDPTTFANRWNPGAGLMSSETPEWYTPRHVVEAVVRALGIIDLDPCAEPARSFPATSHLTPAEDGLTHPWVGSVYMNPPYGRSIGDWTGKLRDEFVAGRVTEAVALLPARTETDWWATLDADWICFIHGRLAFSDAATSAPFPSAAVYLGTDGPTFAAAFAELGPIYRRYIP